MGIPVFRCHKNSRVHFSIRSGTCLELVFRFGLLKSHRMASSWNCQLSSSLNNFSMLSNAAQFSSFLTSVSAMSKYALIGTLMVMSSAYFKIHIFGEFSRALHRASVYDSSRILQCLLSVGSCSYMAIEVLS